MSHYQIHRRILPGRLGIALAVLAYGISGGMPAEPASISEGKTRPNIILCMADDHGWHEVGYYGHRYLKTPALDEMASQGLRFDRFYSAAPVCSPTRGSVLTGRHPNRYGTFVWNYTIRPEETTIARILKSAGYSCGHFGKWHLGPVKGGSPTNPGAMGFDHWLSHDNYFGYNPRLVRDGAAPERFAGESSEIVVSEAIRFIRGAAKKNKPFFTVIWFGSPHEPYAGIDDDIIPYANLDKRLRHRFAEITAMDRAIGQLRKYLETAGLRDDTLLWYSSDNGTPREGCVETKLRGHKGTLYEGGVRVPAIIEWPAVIKTPRVTSIPSVTSDILPTLCDLLGVSVPARPLDGISLVPLLDGRMDKRPKPICFWQYDFRQEEAEKLEPWIDPALQKGTTPTSKVYSIQFQNFRHPVAKSKDFGGYAAITGNRYKLVAPISGPLEMYDIQADPGETKDLARQHPDVVAEMEKALHDWQRSVEVSLTGADYRK